MDKVNKQIELNVSLIVFSCLVIYIVKSVALGRLAQLQECAGADIVFAMITSLSTMVAWRVIEQVQGKFLFLYNILVFIFLVLFAIIYGIAIAMDENKAVMIFIYISAGIFLVLYVVENIIIINHFKKEQTATETYFGFRYRGK